MCFKSRIKQVESHFPKNKSLSQLLNKVIVYYYGDIDISYNSSILFKTRGHIATIYLKSHLNGVNSEGDSKGFLGLPLAVFLGLAGLYIFMRVFSSARTKDYESL